MNKEVNFCCCEFCASTCTKCSPNGCCERYRNVTNPHLHHLVQIEQQFINEKISKFRQPELKEHVRKEIEMFIALSRPRSDSYSNTNLHISFYCGGRLNTNRIQMCKTSYANHFGRGKTFINDIIREIKDGVVCKLETPFNKRSKVPADILASLSQKAGVFGYHVTQEELSLAKMVDKPIIFSCVAWMREHFNLCGDCQPNRNNEIHLEPIDKLTIYKEYKHDFKTYSVPQPSVLLKVFYLIWLDQFPHVKIREYKACGGKCNTCASLSDARSRDSSQAGRKEYTALHAFHRTMYMGQRQVYYTRRFLSISQPEQFLSTISDGMAQLHNELPHRANLAPFSHKLKCHLQGVIVHGKRFQIYRTYNNISGGANCAIHVWLLELEKEFRKFNRLPDTLFHQIDGGAENANKACLAIAELIVAKRLTKKIVITRLPPGHTHEDIDSKFGVIWTRFRNCHVRTPQEAERLFRQAFKSHDKGEKLFFDIKDVFVVPDYWYYLKPFIKPKFGKSFKEEWTQLQWTFEAIEPSPQFPLGVKVTYQSYAGDSGSEVWEIWEKDSVQLIDSVPSNSTTEYIPVKTKVFSYPEPSVSNPSGGNCLLKAWPVGELCVMPGVKGARAELDKTIAAAKTVFNTENDLKSIDEWEEFGKDYPESDDTQAFCSKKEQLIPFWDILFDSDSDLTQRIEDDSLAPINLYAPDSQGCFTATATASVRFDNDHNETAARRLLPDPRLFTTDVLPSGTRRKRTEAAYLRNYNPQRLAAIMAQTKKKAGISKENTGDKNRRKKVTLEAPTDQLCDVDVTSSVVEAVDVHCAVPKKPKATRKRSTKQITNKNDLDGTTCDSQAATVGHCAMSKKPKAPRKRAVIQSEVIQDTSICLCCCGCESDATGSHHYCSISGKRMMSFCADYPFDGSFGSTSPCRSCVKNQQHTNQPIYCSSQQQELVPLREISQRKRKKPSRFAIENGSLEIDDDFIDANDCDDFSI